MKKYSIRPSLSTFLFLGTFLGVLIGVGFVSIYLLLFPNIETYLIIIFALLGITIMDIIIYQNKIELTDTLISSNQSIFQFHKKQTIQLSDLEEMKIEIGSQKDKNGLYTLYFIGKENSLQINMKSYGLLELEMLIKKVYRDNKDIKIDHYIKKIVKGEYPF